MKTLCLLAAFVTLSFTAGSQNILFSSFELWNNNQPAGWMGIHTNIANDSIQMVTDNILYGSKACKIINRTNIIKQFSSVSFRVIQDISYEITFWKKGSGTLQYGIMYDSIFCDLGNVMPNTSWTKSGKTITSTFASHDA